MNTLVSQGLFDTTKFEKIFFSMTKRVALPFNHLFWFGIGDAPCQKSVKINLRDPYIIFF